VCKYHNRKGKIPSSQGKKQNEASLYGSNFMIFISKKHFLAKKSHTVMRTVTNQNVFAYNSRTDRDILKNPTDLDSASQNYFSYVNP
jgi:hypothetical protein